MNNLLIENQAKVGSTLEMKLKMTLPQIVTRKQFKVVFGMVFSLEQCKMRMKQLGLTQIKKRSVFGIVDERDFQDKLALI
jgi:hypothetical protein